MYSKYVFEIISKISFLPSLTNSSDIFSTILLVVSNKSFSFLSKSGTDKINALFNFAASKE